MKKTVLVKKYSRNSYGNIVSLEIEKGTDDVELEVKLSKEKRNFKCKTVNIESYVDKGEPFHILIPPHHGKKVFYGKNLQVVPDENIKFIVDYQTSVEESDDDNDEKG